MENQEVQDEIRIAQWQVAFDDAFTEEDALLASQSGTLPGKTYSFTLPWDTTIDLDEIRNIKAPIKSGALLLCTIEADHDGIFPFGMGVDWWFTSFINGEKALDLGTAGNNGEVSVLTNVFRMNLKKGKNFFAALTRRGGASWCFTFMPITESIILRKGPSLSIPYYQKLIAQYNGLAAAPWCFNISIHTAKIGAVFHSEVICGIRYREKTENDGPWIEKWASSYGQKEAKLNHIFDLQELKGDTLYEYQILRLNELAPALEILYKDTFRTYPEKGVEHSFFALSDLQASSYTRGCLVKDFLTNCRIGNTQFLASLGDIASDFTDFISIYFNTYLSIVKNCGYTKPYAMVRGNHEYRGRSQFYTRFFGRPYYSFQWGDVYYFVLDTGEDKAMHAARPHLYTLKTDLDEFWNEQRNWLMQEVEKEECKKAKYHIVLAHAAPFAWIFDYYAEKIALLAGEAFYGENPKCKLDLWLCGDVHCPFRFDPASGEVYGGVNKKNELYRKYVMGSPDRENIFFPVYINSGPSCSNVDFSLTRVDIREKEIEILMQDPDGNILDNVIFRKEGGMEVRSTTFIRYPLQKELEAQGIDTPPLTKRTPEIPWSTLPYVDVEE